MTDAPVLDDVVSIGDYVAVIKRRKWVIVAVALLIGALAAVYVETVESVYRSEATVLIRPITRDPLDGFERPSQLIDLSTETQLVTSATVATRARELLDSTESVPNLLERVTVEAPTDSQLLNISYTANDAEVAAAGATAFAESYLDFRGRRAAEALASSVESIQQRMAALNEELEESTAVVAKLADSPEDLAYLEAQGQRTLLSNQIALLSGSLAERLGVDVAAGEIIGPADVPEDPISPNPLRTLVIAVAAGLVLGVAVAFVIERLDDRVNVPFDVEHALAVPVVATIRRSLWRPGLRHGRTPSAADAYRRAAMAVAGHADQEGPFVLVVASGRSLPERSDTTIDLANTLARDHRVLMIDGSGEPGPLGVFVDASSDVDPDISVPASSAIVSGVAVVSLTDRLDVLPEAWRRVDGKLGTTAKRFDWLLQRIGDRYDYILVDAPPIHTSADALELHELAHHVLVVARLRKTSVGELSELRAQLSTFGMAAVGAVVHTHRRRRSGALRRLAALAGRRRARNGVQAVDADTSPAAADDNRDRVRERRVGVQAAPGGDSDDQV